MGRTRKSANSRQTRPALTPEAREDQLISLASDLAEKQLRDGTASSQVIVHYLRLATKKERLEEEMLARRTEHLAAQTESLQATKRVEELYENALKAMKEYGGGGSEEYDEELF